MAEREEEDACSGESSRVLNFREEARQSLAEVAYAIGEGVLSQKLHNDSEGAYCNITTLEGKRFCVRLSWRGFEVIGKEYDSSQDEAAATAFETVYSLLDHISPSYRANFHRQVANKLNRLQEAEARNTDTEIT